MTALKAKPLGTQAIVIAGQSPEGKFYNRDGQGLPFYQGKRDFGDRELMQPTTWTTQTTKEAIAGDILMSVRAPVGPINFARERICIGRGLAAIRSRDELDTNFLYYQLLGMQDEIAGKEGAVFASINKAEIEALPVFVPAIEDQHRIVTILDEAFEGIATAKANAEKSLQNVGMFLEQSLTAIFDHGYCCDAPKHSLGSLATFRNGLNFSKHSKGQLVRIVGVKDFQKNFSVPVAGLETITMDGFLGEADRVAEGDIVFVRSNGNPALIGRCMVVGSLDAPTTHSGFTIKMRLHGDLVSPTYACHFLKSPAVRKQLVAGGNGANIKSLNQGTLSSVAIPVPPLKVQELIVADIEQLTEEAERLVSVYQRKLTALEELKKSLLHQAFSGQL